MSHRPLRFNSDIPAPFTVSGGQAMGRQASDGRPTVPGFGTPLQANTPTARIDQLHKTDSGTAAIRSPNGMISVPS